MKKLEKLKEGVYATYYTPSDKQVHIGCFMCQTSDGKYAFDREKEPYEFNGHLAYYCIQRWDYIENPEHILTLWSKVNNL